MSLEEILSKDIFWDDICIVGVPASGKTFLSEKLKKHNPYHEVIHSDIYKIHGYEEGLYYLMDDLAITPAPRITEGVLCYRALRKGIETNTYKPDVVIICETSKKRQQEIYHAERDAKKLAYMKIFEIGLMTVYNKWYAIKDPQTEIITFENNY